MTEGIPNGLELLCNGYIMPKKQQKDRSPHLEVRMVNPKIHLDPKGHYT